MTLHANHEKRGFGLFFFVYFCRRITKQKRFIMKVKLSKAQITAILNDPEKAEKAGVTANDPWWVIVLKVIAYAIGLILAGAATTSCTHLIGII